jgi:hypothetical protein
MASADRESETLEVGLHFVDALPLITSPLCGH